MRVTARVYVSVGKLLCATCEAYACYTQHAFNLWPVCTVVVIPTLDIAIVISMLDVVVIIPKLDVVVVVVIPTLDVVVVVIPTLDVVVVIIPTLDVVVVIPTLDEAVVIPTPTYNHIILLLNNICT